MSADVERHVIGDALWWSYVPDSDQYDDMVGGLVWVKFPITRVTAKRIYFLDHRRQTYCDRANLEAGGYAKVRGIFLHLNGPDDFKRRQAEDQRAWLDSKADTVRQLRREAAAAHPDRGGNNTEFIAAHKRYVAAREALQRTTPHHA